MIYRSSSAEPCSAKRGAVNIAPAFQLLEAKASVTMLNLQERIRHFYDRSTPLWLSAWGEHMHHGHYGPDGLTRKDHRQAQLDLIEEMLRWGDVNKASRILDAGCGVGGSSRYLAQRFGASALGLTLSPVQAEGAAALNRTVGLDQRVEVEVRDMMAISPATDGLFDLVWSMESAEHVPDKAGMLRRFYEVLQPGGTLLLATWCHRPIPPPLSGQEQDLLDGISRHYHLPPWVSRGELARLAMEAGFSKVETADWSKAVAPFWNAVMRSALQWRNLGGLLRAGWPTLKGAWAMRYMQRGFREGVIEFAVLRGTAGPRSAP